MIPSPKDRSASFTLVEMLVAISIMSLMLLAMAQMTALSEQAWRTEQNRIDNFSKARAMLSLFTDDLQRGVFRGDLPAFGTNAPSAPTLTSGGLYYYTNTGFSASFYTRQPGLAPSSTAVRDVSLVSYNVTNTLTPEKVILQRSDLDVPWTGGAANLVFQGDMGTALTKVTAQEMAPGVVGFAFAFRQANGTMIAPSSYIGYNPTSPPGPVVAVDVCLAVIGKQSLAELTTSQVQAIQTALAGAVTSSNLTSHGGIKAIWDQQTLPTFFTGSYPKDLGGGLKTFECWVACQPF
jgi:type II secretory pathway pseudopilin PulG